jgi:hypothetical protein
MRFCFIILASIAFQNILYAQDSIARKAPIEEQKDVWDLIHKKHQDEPTATKRILFAFLPAAGYTLQTGFAAVLGANLAFYSKPSEGGDQKISSILTSYAYSQHRQSILPLDASIWSKNGKFNYITDWRYMNYPSETWGLGGQTNGFIIDFSYIKLHQTLLFNIRKNLFIGAGYFYDSFFNIRGINAPSGDIVKYGLNSSQLASGIPVRILYDSRLNQVNPQKGWYASVTFRENYKFLGSKQNWRSLVSDVRKYIPFPAYSHNILAIWSYTWLTNKGTPYLLLPSTGWDDFFNTGRGYIQGRFRSKNMLYLETEYRFRISENGLFGGVVFVNVESYKRDLTIGPQILAAGYGGGLRIKLNKHSGANLCIDYGIGKDGSKGFFINLGEVF